MKKLILAGVLLIALTKMTCIGIQSQMRFLTVSYRTPITTAIYPPFLANQPLDAVIDRWGMDNRECVSYTAWKVQSTFHDMPNWSHVRYVPNAFNWPALAMLYNIPISNHPTVHSVAIAYPGTALRPGEVAGSNGHAMWVEGVSPDGKSIEVSQYNYLGDGNYSTMTIPVAPSMSFINFGARRL